MSQSRGNLPANTALYQPTPLGPATLILFPLFLIPSLTCNDLIHCHCVFLAPLPVERFSKAPPFTPSHPPARPPNPRTLTLHPRCNDIPVLSP